MAEIVRELRLIVWLIVLFILITFAQNAVKWGQHGCSADEAIAGAVMAGEPGTLTTCEGDG